jgi:hypothetical protein
MKPVTILVDPGTHRIVAQRYEAGAGLAMEEQFSDYRNISGLQVAFTTVVLKAGLPFVSRHLRTFEYNVPLQSELFTKPS